ncbi:MAG TPA: aromatic-ring-hydroxylating dioxygenase subunit beta [Candidatus Binataceae bacterium]|nr:aromatic-ring-hydroxylating dioxygenase subunit beta [Candidatus Binataceae bacterium]
MTVIDPTGAAQREVEQFLYREAQLLDEWRLDEWFELMTEDVSYHVPAPDALTGDPAAVVSLVADNAVWLRSRVAQLMGKAAWAENPRSRTRRLVTNVQLVSQEGEELRVFANFAVYRIRYEIMDIYVGHYEYRLVRREGGLRIRERRAILDLESLRPHGKLSIIL